jgi:hypothetical protein
MADGCVGDPGTSRCPQLRPKLLTANSSHREDEHASKGITKPIRQEMNVKILQGQDTDSRWVPGRGFKKPGHAR